MLGKRLPSHQGDGQSTTRVERDQKEGCYWLRGWRRLRPTIWLCCQGQKTPEAKNREEEEELVLCFFSLSISQCELFSWTIETRTRVTKQRTHSHTDPLNDHNFTRTTTVPLGEDANQRQEETKRRQGNSR